MEITTIKNIALIDKTTKIFGKNAIFLKKGAKLCHEQMKYL